ncbi:amiloride-sensitive sodium channel pickpocket 17 [Anticarsia gemmatalis]|uniref:amiloride-sensitive sodium channel pickpocket 17 n=1 Tax=Anticarsia gemmatalis TaxID=129554 RepID=UPI003F7644CC
MNEEKEVDPKWTIRQKCAECIKGPGNAIKTLIIMVCIAVVIQQITACVKKLIDVPITTYTHFDFNKTLMYPSVTFCREPSYKFDKMLEYGLYAHPRFTSTWRNFDFANTNLDDFWNDVTYNESDMFVHSGLNGLVDNVYLNATMGFVLGRCYTMSPKILSTEASRASGYSITLHHTAEDIATTASIYPPGYHVYLHYTKEPFTEITVYNGGLVDKLYVNVGETVEIKLKVDQYFMISSEDDPCVGKTNYSTNACTAEYVWKRVGDEVGCSGPWMESELPRCDNFTKMSALITSYMNTYETHNCDVCPRTCCTYLYNGYVTDRQRYYTWDTDSNTWFVKTGGSDLQTHIYIYFNSMMVSVYQERFNYDWNLFISDLGGSVGFLLGLSVIGLLEIFGKTWRIFIKPLIKSKKKGGSTSSVTSTDTADVKARQEYIDEWNPKIIAE